MPFPGLTCAGQQLTPMGGGPWILHIPSDDVMQLWMGPRELSRKGDEWQDVDSREGYAEGGCEGQGGEASSRSRCVANRSRTCKEKDARRVEKNLWMQ